jgi:acetyl-CoA carboxylase biotin carboxylase subunit
VEEKECAVWKEEDLLKHGKGSSAAAFGNDGMYLEKLIEEPRHIEIQVIDSYGKACHLLKETCCSKTSPKTNEETPSPFMTDELRLAMEIAVKAAEYIKYEGWYSRVFGRQTP